MKILAGFLIALGLAIVLLLAVVYSGAVNVAATEPHLPLVEWALETTRHRSIHARTEDLVVPELEDPRRIEVGMRHYTQMCVVCHGAPGVKRSEIGVGLNPAPPELWQDTHLADEAKEAFWIVKHGIRMTGMPAFGETHSDEEIWAIVAAVVNLNRLSAGEYQRLTGPGGQAAGEAEQGHAHEH